MMVSSFVDRLRRNIFIKYGMPTFFLVIGGSLYLREFAKLRHEFPRVKPVDLEELKKMGYDVEKYQVKLEDVYGEMVKENFWKDDWKNIRAPRPWEDNKEFYERVESLKDGT